MSSREWRLRVQDILLAICRIQSYSDGLSFEEFETFGIVTQAILYNFIIIGEAANHIPSELQLRYSEIPWRNVCGMRNVVVHEYFQLELETIWDTIYDDLPTLARQFQNLLDCELNH